MKYTIVTIIIVLSYDNRDKATINFCQYCTYTICNLILLWSLIVFTFYYCRIDDDNPIHDDHCKFTFTTSLHS